MATTRKAAAEADPLDTLREPFDADLIKGKSVAPVHYILKLVNSGEKYTVKQTVPVILAFGDAAAVAVVSSIDFAGQTVEGVGATAVDSSAESKELAKNIKSAASDSLKRALLNLGVNTDEYLKPYDDEDEEEEKPARRSKSKPKAKAEEPDEDDEEEPEEKPRSSRRGSSRGSSRASKWTGEDEVGFGKHKDSTWAEVPGSYLKWLSEDGEDGPNKDKAGKEIDRRGDDYDPEEGNDKPRRSSSRRSSGRSKGRAGRFD